MAESLKRKHETTTESTPLYLDNTVTNDDFVSRKHKVGKFYGTFNSTIYVMPPANISESHHIYDIAIPEESVTFQRVQNNTKRSVNRTVLSKDQVAEYYQKLVKLFDGNCIDFYPYGAVLKDGHGQCVRTCVQFAISDRTGMITTTWNIPGFTFSSPKSFITAIHETCGGHAPRIATSTTLFDIARVMVRSGSDVLSVPLCQFLPWPFRMKVVPMYGKP